MKVRIGLGLGPMAESEDLTALVDRLEEAGVDSLWFSEQVTAPVVDPVVGLAHAASRTRRLKLGTGVSVLPGRHPVRVAKQLASLAWLAPRRILPVFGLQPAREAERAFFPVPAGRRGAVLDESLTLVRLLLGEPRVTFRGEFFSVEDASVGFRLERPLDLWLGGSAPAGLRRVGRLADGWLGSFLTPEEAHDAIQVIRDAATEAGRAVDEDHYGMSLPVALTAPDERLLATVAARRPGTDPRVLVPQGWDELRRVVSEHVAAGVSKFVVRPAAPPESWERFVAGFCAELLPLQTQG
ncbi:TIGR03854 family LLM class F420-dependent oxidoreductase [Blastococcus sp. TF02A-26]|uniref:TIGR03854 family LLM class F420-dependent oxidoreductase n=1 Tax=Blastococcus sp. TF02A-26 TaxID=2250577 RepID=UPI000DEAEE17|nr:TIGR03854 family LLM class F420-dependent oxidoreductase [Blastococcus sp. TF02A-26]RBY86864.1 TIGR03854 family LLM class F420-dependent oxidoreductase [Blastococcus sp. TF02A-26]